MCCVFSKPPVRFGSQQTRRRSGRRLSFSPLLSVEHIIVRLESFLPTRQKSPQHYGQKIRHSFVQTVSLVILSKLVLELNMY